MISIFAAEELHIVPHAEKIVDIAGVPITNSFLLGIIVSGFLVWFMSFVASRMRIKSGGRTISVIELVCEFIINMASDVMHSREKANKYAPFLITLFLFILFNNWAGLLPGVTSIYYGAGHLLRGWTSDLTGTLALSVTSIILIQIYAFRELKVKGVLTHYFSNQPWNPINLFIGLLEVLGEFTRMASLSLRLFGNIFAGEVLLVVLAAVSGFFAPLSTMPFIFMELFVGFIQSFVFTTLVIVYLSLATHHEEQPSRPKDHQPASNPAVQNMATAGSPK